MDSATAILTISIVAVVFYYKVSQLTNQLRDDLLRELKTCITRKAQCDVNARRVQELMAQNENCESYTQTLEKTNMVLDKLLAERNHFREETKRSDEMYSQALQKIVLMAERFVLLQDAHDNVSERVDAANETLKLIHAIVVDILQHEKETKEEQKITQNSLKEEKCDPPGLDIRIVIYPVVAIAVLAFTTFVIYKNKTKLCSSATQIVLPPYDLIRRTSSQAMGSVGSMYSSIENFFYPNDNNDGAESHSDRNGNDTNEDTEPKRETEQEEHGTDEDNIMAERAPEVGVLPLSDKSQIRDRREGIKPTYPAEDKMSENQAVCGRTNDPNAVNNEHHCEKMEAQSNACHVGKAGVNHNGCDNGSNDSEYV